MAEKLELKVTFSGDAGSLISETEKIKVAARNIGVSVKGITESIDAVTDKAIRKTVTLAGESAKQLKALTKAISPVFQEELLETATTLENAAAKARNAARVAASPERLSPGFRSDFRLTIQQEKLALQEFGEFTRQANDKRIENLQKLIAKEHVIRKQGIDKVKDLEADAAKKELEIRTTLQAKLFSLAERQAKGDLTKSQANFGAISSTVSAKIATEKAFQPVSAAKQALIDFALVEKGIKERKTFEIKQAEERTKALLQIQENFLKKKAAVEEANFKLVEDGIKRQKALEVKREEEKAKAILQIDEFTHKRRIAQAQQRLSQEERAERESNERRIKQNRLNAQAAFDLTGNRGLAATFRQDFKTGAKDLESRLALEKSIRLRGINDLRTLELRASQDEISIKQNLQSNLEKIDKLIAEGSINSLDIANKTRVKLENDAAKEITRIRRALEKEQAKPIKAAESANIFKQQTETQLHELENRLALEQSIRVNGAKHVKTLLLKAAQEEIEIKRNLQVKLLALEQQVAAGSNRGQINLVRVTAIRQAEGAITAIRKQSEELEKARVKPIPENVLGSHRSLFLRVGELIGIYRILNSTINQVIAGITAIPKIGIQLDATEASLTSTTGSAAGFAGALNFLNEEAERTGRNVLVLRETFRTFQASASLGGLGLDDTVKSFQNLNTVITALHKTGEEANNIFLAFSQILNKGKVQSEELVKQLGNLIPGAFASFAASIKNANGTIGIETEELSRRLEAGTVRATETLKDFTEFLVNRFGDAFSIATTRLQADVGRLQTSFIHLGEAIFSETNDAMQSVVQGLTKITNALTKAIPKIKEFVSWFKDPAFAAGVTAAGIAIGALAFKIVSTPISLFIVGISAIAAGLASAADKIKKELDAASPPLNKFTENLRNAREASEQLRGALSLKINVEGDKSVKIARQQLEELTAELAKIKSGDSLQSISLKSLEDLKLELPDLKFARADFSKVEHGFITLSKEKLEGIFEQVIVEATKRLNQALASAQASINQAKKDEAVRVAAQKQQADRISSDLQGTFLEAEGQILASQGRIAEANEKFRQAEISKIKKDKEEQIETVRKIIEDEERLREKERKLKEAGVVFEATFNENRLAKAKEAEEKLRVIQEAALLKVKIKPDIKDPLRDVKIATNEIERTIDALSFSFKRGEVSINSYFQKLGELRQKINGLEGQGIEDALTLTQEQDPGNIQKIQELQDKLQEVAAKGSDIARQTSQEMFEALEAHNRELQSILVENFRLAGKEGLAAIIEFDAKVKPLLKQLNSQIKENNDPTAIAAKSTLNVNRLLTQGKAEFLEITKKINLEETRLQLLEEKITRDEGLGLITKLESLNKLSEAREKFTTFAEKELDLLDKTKFTAEGLLEIERARANIRSKATGSSETLSGIIKQSDTLGFSNIIDEFNEKQKLIKDIERNEIKNIDRDFKAQLEQAELIHQQNLANIRASALPTDANALLMAETLAFQAQTELAEEEHQIRLANIKAKAAEASSVTTRVAFTSMAAIGANVFSELTNASVQFFGAQSKQARAAFIAFKVFKIAEATITAQDSILNAYNAGLKFPLIGGPITATIFAAIAGAAQAARIAAIVATPLPSAHGGLTEVPREQTFLLDKGERVLSPNQNRDLTQALDNGSIGNNTPPVVNVKNINVLDPSIVGEFLATREGEDVVMNIVKRNRAA